jgi:hypothetical protein
MFRQVFSKLFFTKSNNESESSSSTVVQRQIYAIPTVSSNIQSMSSSNFETKKVVPFNNNNNGSLECKKYIDSNTRHIYIAPHCIRYTNSTLDNTIYRIDEESLNEIAAEILDSDTKEPPKLQIVFYKNNYFAINNSHLQIYKQLELCGFITHCLSDLINIEAIPIKLREHLLRTPEHLLELENMSSNHEIIQTENEEDEDDLDSYVEENNSNCLNSGSTSSGNSASEDSDNKLIDETYEFGK